MKYHYLLGILFKIIWLVSLFTYVYSHPQHYSEDIDLTDPSNRFSGFKEKFLDPVSLAEDSKVYLKRENFLSSGKLMNQLNFLENSDSDDNCELRPNNNQPNFYYFIPLIKATLKTEGDRVSFANECYKSNTVVLEKFSQKETILRIFSDHSKNLLCGDSYWIATSNIHTIKNIMIHGNYQITLKNLSQDDLDEIRINGIKVLSFCQGFFTTLHSLFDSLELYLGGLGNNPSSLIPIIRPTIPAYMETANLKFLEDFTHFKPASRGENGKRILEIDEKEIKTGDFVAIYRLDGLDPLIMFGSGSRLGHTAVACWIDGELYILESQDGWYWPKRGIQRNKWKQWVEWAFNADFNVAILPLKEEIRQKFNVDKALQWFTSGIEGLNYGYHNFLFGWIDTPDQNVPRNILQPEVFLPVFSVLEKITQSTFNTIMGEALNHRISTKGLTISQITAEAARRNFSFEDLLAMPEIEGWQYSDGKNFVCSCFVTAFYKAGGIFEDLYLNATEFTPKDVYQLNIFDRTYKDKRPQVCKDADPDLEYCQVIGKFQILLNNYSTIAPYANMNEKCPSIAPDYFRPDGC